MANNQWIKSKSSALVRIKRDVAETVDGRWFREKNGNLHAEKNDNTKTMAEFLGTSQKKTHWKFCKEIKSVRVKGDGLRLAIFPNFH